MSNSNRLSEVQKKLGGGKTLTKISNGMDDLITQCVEETKMHLISVFGNNIKLQHETKIFLKDVIDKLKKTYPNEKWVYKFNTSYMKPDGGFLYLLDKNSNKYPILIVEMKKQGTNDEVIATKGKKQASGNAIERLGKNVIGLRTWMKNESIFPFVCFGYGWDFKPESTILDRVGTIAEFGELNTTNLHDTEHTKRGSFYFNQHPLTKKEISAILNEIAVNSVYYYFSKYSREKFI